jgi:ATP-dependent Lon protease
VVIFPHSEVALTTRDQRTTTALLQAAKESQLVVVVPSYNSKDVTGSIGTLALLRKTAVAGRGVNASVKGLWRVRVESVLEEMPYARVRFTKANEIDDASTSKSRIVQVVLGQIDEFVKLIPGVPAEIIEALKSAETLGKLADLCASSPSFSPEERLDLLRTMGAEERLEKVTKHFERQLAALRELAKVKKITDCEICTELADRALEAEPRQRGEIVLEFLNHVVREHTGELLGLLAEKYGPEFMRKRALK